MVAVSRTTPNWNQAIMDCFQRTQNALRCTRCNTNWIQDVETNIVAAPQILRIALQIFGINLIPPRKQVVM